MMDWQMFDMVTALDKLGYDRYRIEGNCMTSICRAWKKGEDEKCIQYVASSPGLAMGGVLAWAELLAGQKDDESVVEPYPEEEICFPGIPKIIGEWLEHEKAKLGIEP